MTRSLRGAHQKTLGADKGYDKSINSRKQIEQVFGWIKQPTGSAIQRRLHFKSLLICPFAARQPVYRTVYQ
jgi:hypothetical protein